MSPAVIELFTWFASLLQGEVNSIAVVSVGGGVAGPTPNRPPVSSGLGTCHDGVDITWTTYNLSKYY